MKRDMDLIRAILLHVEKHDDLEFRMEGVDDRTVRYHVRLLNEAGLLRAVAITLLNGEIQLQDAGGTSLTWGGHEFLDAARNETVWKKARSIVAKKAGTVSFDVFKALLTSIAMRAVGL